MLDLPLVWFTHYADQIDREIAVTQAHAAGREANRFGPNGTHI